MEKNQLKGVWNQLKGQAKVKWGKLTDNDLSKVEGEYDKLCGILQEKYNYSKEKAMKEVKEFLDKAE